MTAHHPPPPPDHQPESSFFGFTPLNWAVAALLLVTLALLAFSRFLVFHTLVEVLSVTVAWATFLLLWNARRYLEDRAFLVLGVGLFLSGGIDLIHVMAYKGMGVLDDPLEGNLSTQLWVSARTVETLAWAGLVFLRRRRHVVGPASAVMTGLTLAFLLLIFPLDRFPPCFAPGTGLTAFKVGMEYLFIGVLLASLGQLFRNRAHYPSRVYRDIAGALALIALGEMAFTLYADVFSVSNVAGHILRFFSRLLSYRALIQLGINEPYNLFFRELQKEKDQASAAENMLRAITRATTDHITDLDRDLCIRFVNFPSPGLTRDHLLGSSILKFLPPGDQGRVEAILRRVMAEGETETYETEYAEPGGQTLHYETRASRRVDEEGLTQGLTLVSRNVTERRRRDELFAARLRISEFALTHSVAELLTKVLDEAEALTGSTIGFFHFVQDNQVELQLQAWSTNTLENMCNAEGHGAHYPLNEAGVWADCLRRNTPLIHNDYAAMPDKKGMPEGHATILREAVVPISREGRHVAVFGVGNKEAPFDESDLQLLTELGDLAWDIVVRKRAEITLQESERRMARTMANLPGMVFRCINDEHWTMKFVSEGCRELTGYLPGDLLDNRAVSYASIIHHEDRDAVNKGVQLGLDSHTPYQIVYRIIDRAGNLKWVWEQGRGLWNGDVLEFIEGFIYDISEQIEAREEHQAMEKRILETQKLESLGVLAGGIAHDFNNLLQAMLGFAEMARLQIGGAHPAQDSITNVIDAAGKAAGLTRQMLAFSGKGQFSISEVDLSQHVREMADLLESSVPKYVEFRRELIEHLPPIEADATQLQQVIMNLITNAAEAIGEQEGRIILRTGKIHCDEECLAANRLQYESEDTAPRPGDFVFVEVRDTGSGMDPDVLHRIFEPFFTTKFTGRGLGMAAVQGILRGHGGAMLIETEPGQGSLFRVLLPCATPRPRTAEPEASRGPGREEPSGPRTVLVVDDEQKVRDLISLGLGEAGFETLCAGDGLEALRIYEDEGPRITCVLLDLIMPRMSGKECLARLREMDPEVVVVIMSGYSEGEIRERLADLPTAGILAKPFQVQQLLEIMDRVAPMVPETE